MKNIILLLISIWLSNIVFGQATNVFCDFESECDVIRIDTGNAYNIWQIGFANKPNFLFETNSIVTDTLLAYPTNNYSVFHVKIPRALWDFWIFIQFDYMLDTDEGKDGGYIEISSDNGETWENVVNCPYIMDEQWMYTDTNLLFDGSPGFSGSFTNSWPAGFGIEMFELDTLNLRFVFISDSLDTQKSGWSIDNIYFIGWWEGIEEHDQAAIRLYPNPCSDVLHLQYSKSDIRNSKFEVIDISGSVLKTIHFKNQMQGDHNITIDLSEFPAGMYFIRMQSEDNVSMRKIVKQ